MSWLCWQQPLLLHLNPQGEEMRRKPQFSSFTLGDIAVPSLSTWVWDCLS